ncbi:NAD(P)(+) transhydrogenase (Re/Si-specific) subunit alpha, partial [Bdellovibrionota bacterium FG-2]
MTMATLLVGIPKETRLGETRVAAAPDAIKKIIKKGLTVAVGKTAGESAGF